MTLPMFHSQGLLYGGRRHPGTSHLVPPHPQTHFCHAFDENIEARYKPGYQSPSTPIDPGESVYMGEFFTRLG